MGQGRPHTSVLAVEGSTDARFYRVAVYGTAMLEGCRPQLVNLSERRLSTLGTIATLVRNALGEALRVLPRRLHDQVQRNIVVATCREYTSVVFIVAFGGRDELLKHIKLLLSRPPGLPEPREVLTLAAILDMDASSAVAKGVFAEALRPLEGTTCGKVYVTELGRVNLLLGFQGLGGSRRGLCLPQGVLEDYIPYVLQRVRGISVAELEAAYNTLRGQGLVTCCEPKHVYPLLRLRLCKSTDYEVLRELDASPDKVADELKRLDPCIVGLLRLLIRPLQPASG